jgi:isoleucyl-tRNA synthetase
VTDVQEKPGQGADTLRVWAASVDYTRDVSIGPNAIKHASESLRKIRSAMRFLLANTSGETARDLSGVELGPVSHSRKGDTDRQLELYILHELSQLEAQAIASYDVFAFNKGKAVNLCCS